MWVAMMRIYGTIGIRLYLDMVKVMVRTFLGWNS